VNQVAVASGLPGLGANGRTIEIEGRPVSEPKQRPQASYMVQTPQGLSLIGLPLLVGRGFSDTDGETGKEAAIVTREFADVHWPGESPVGKRFRFLDDNKPGAWMTVIGVTVNLVQDMRPRNRHPLLFIPYHQEPWGWMSLLLKTSGDPATLAAPVRATVSSLDQDLPLFEVQTLPAALDHDRWFLKVFGTLFLTFAITGLVMAAVGIYAVIAQATARRTREIGIRIALGAVPREILGLVLGQGAWLALAGVALGVLGALSASRLLAGLLFGVTPTDLATYLGTALTLLGVAAVAALVPALRATRTDPVEALRSE